ncbi:MAG: AAA family ATPase [Undibacterium sp.]|nr:AAA family ATPase [Opitutaceae bacterium]
MSAATESPAVVEARFIAAVIKDGEGDRWRECKNLSSDAFTNSNHGKVWRTIAEAETYEAAATARSVLPYFSNETVGADYIKDRDAIWIGWLTKEGIAFAPQWLATLPGPATKAQLVARLDARRFNHAAPPVEPAPRFSIAGRSVCTPGNLTNIIAQAKAGKTAVIAAAIAAVICAEQGDTSRDTLGITATAPGAKRVLHFDTEQSPFDHDQLVRRALRRSGATDFPLWLDSYGLAGFSASELRASLILKMKQAKAQGGLFAVIIDGTADLVNDVNDPKECNAFVAELHALAIEHDCPILNVVHENPGQDGGKIRGHLGSQLERKAESNLRLKKTDEITVIFSEKMRKAPILEIDGPRIRWSDEAGMHVSCETVGKTRDDAKREALRDRAESLFHEAKKDSLTWKEFTQETTERTLREMLNYGVVQKMFGGTYKLAK